MDPILRRILTVIEEFSDITAIRCAINSGIFIFLMKFRGNRFGFSRKEVPIHIEVFSVFSESRTFHGWSRGESAQPKDSHIV